MICGLMAGNKGCQKKNQGPELTCTFFFPKILTENSGVFFSGTPEISARVFFVPGSGSERVMRPKPLKNRYLGCIEGLHKMGQKETAGRG